MPASTDPHSLLSRYYRLPSGGTVRLRLARRSDVPALRELFSGRGVEATDLDLTRLVRYDPWSRVVVCACAAVAGREELAAVGAIDLELGAEPDTLVVDEHFADGLGELLGSALRDRAEAHARRVA